VGKVTDLHYILWYPAFSGCGLGSLERNGQLQEWVGELATPKVAALNLFFNPMSFLTAIMQDTSIKNSFDLDQMALVSDVLKKMPDAIEYGRSTYLLRS